MVEARKQEITRQIDTKKAELSNIQEMMHLIQEESEEAQDNNQNNREGSIDKELQPKDGEYKNMASRFSQPKETRSERFRDKKRSYSSYSSESVRSDRRRKDRKNKRERKYKKRQRSISNDSSSSYERTKRKSIKKRRS